MHSLTGSHPFICGSEYSDFSFVRFFRAGKYLDQSGFAGPVFPCQANNLPRLQLQAHILQYLYAGKGFADSVYG